jgi:thiamine transport system ATP-binding protein
MIRLEDVTYRYEAMEMRFNLHVPRGNFMAITGPSGAGKTTLLMLIAGFERPISGSIALDGRLATDAHPSERPLSMIFQDHNSFAHLDTFTNVALGVSPKLKLSDAQRQIVDAALARTGLASLAHRKPTEISGGERQRIAIARALVRDRPILLLDEPFTALGPALREDMLTLILDLQRERGLTVLMVTHQPLELKQAASHFAFIDQGHVTAVYAPGDFFAKTAPEAVRAYLAS